jgi:hypothetical protein
MDGGELTDRITDNIFVKVYFFQVVTDARELP